jgi:hypothetical protein
LNGTAHLTFNPPASGSGTVAVNGMVLPDLPWQGVYFQGIPVQVTAAPAPGYRFAGWDPPDLPQTPAITLTLDAAQAVTPRFDALGDDAPRPGDVVFAGYRIHEDSHIEGGWFELRVTRPGGVDLRGARVGRGTTIRVIVTQTGTNPPEDDLSTWDRQMVLHTGNGNLDTQVDPGFNLGPNDTLVLLAPGPTDTFGDDQGIAFVAAGTAVTPASFGVLADGVSTTPATAAAPPDPQTPGPLSAGGLVLAGLAARYLTVRRTTTRTR